MKFSDSFLDEIRARLPVSAVVSRRVPLKRRGRELVGLSPFNQEKTPSFTVSDQKGFYHCFSSGKHGDIFGFVMETEGLSFPEAVEKLAGDAGLPLPKPDPLFERAAKERLGLFDALEAASVFFEEQLGTRDGREALAYAERRGLTSATIKDFRIGFAPNAKDALKAALIKRGFSETQLLDPGLLVKPDDGRSTYDRFRNRLTIPIVNVRGRIIAFGARALDAATEPKYLNSPETKLFDKGSTVFNFARARGPAFDKGELIVVEGYMDVIALHQAGFQHVVATLGTAFTERQMDQLWQLAPEPIICFDGDRAGEAAAARAIDRMLPVLREGHSYRFAFLPQGSDPDDFVRNEGAGALSRCLAEARPLIDILWQRECAGHNLDTPERRAALEERLEQLLATIANTRVRDHYRRDIKSRLFALWRDLGKRSTASTKASPAPTQGRSGTRPLPSAHGFAITIILALAHHPSLLDHFAEEVAHVDIRQKQLAELLSLLAEAIFRNHGITREHLAALVLRSSHARLFDTLERSSAFRRIAFLQPETPAGEVEEHFAELLYRWTTLKSLDQEVQEQALDLSNLSEADYEQFTQLQQQVANAGLRHAVDDASDRDSAKRFRETVAKLKSENIGAQRGRRPDRRADHR
ncbi:MAG TPA: DNA primase [Methyloceanibacter sp.]|nr:DNA primase [Methyloceanibacter sp.]